MWNLVNPPWKTKERHPREGSVSNLGGMLWFALDNKKKKKRAVAMVNSSLCSYCGWVDARKGKK